MSGEQEIENNERTNVQMVTSVGSSWIICRSKSYSGRIYYFNTFTGEAVWYLSGPEIEKAKKRTSTLQNESGKKFESCPEPKEPPNDIIPTFTSEISNKEQAVGMAGVNNKQIINNQFPKQTTASLCNLCTHCKTNVAQTTDNVGVSQLQIPYNCTPNVGTVTPNHQVMGPSSTKVLPNKSQTSSKAGSDLEQNVVVHNTPLPLSMRFNVMQTIDFDSVSEQRGNSHCAKTYNHTTNATDLRQKLSARRRSNTWKAPNQNMDCKGRETIDKAKKKFIEIIKPAMEIKAHCDVDDVWLQEHASIRDSRLVLNVAPLKNIVSTSGISSWWYVVPDTNVLLNNINLINVIVNSDEKCQLMVPDFVMAELQSKSWLNNTLSMSQAHRVLQIISELFTTGGAVVGKAPISETGELQIFDFCATLLDQGHDVVLVSNNVQLEKYRNNSSLVMLTIPELKKLFMKYESPYTGRKFLCHLDAIKVTVPNGISNTNDTSIRKINMAESTTEKMQEENIARAKNVIPNNTNEDIQTKKVLVKVTVEVGVQTDFKSMHGVRPLKVDKSTTTDTDETGCSENSNQAPTRRGIQLRRNLSNQTDDNKKDKKQFKWRRKRFESTSHNSDETPFNPNQLFENGESNDKTFDCSDIYKDNSNRVGRINRCNDELDNNDEKDCICAMFEVESPFMEQSLRSRSDEWLSRFIQIMEEVLTQTLQQDPPFSNRSLPPPWNIHEATLCIKKKFEYDKDVSAAASKLTNLLFQISDARGMIKVELKPSEFMEMYSYGVYLVDSLQSVLSACEDLRIAADSLDKLLNDIVSPNLDTSHVDNAPELNITQLENGNDGNIASIEKDNEKRGDNVKSSSSPNKTVNGSREIEDSNKSLQYEGEVKRTSSDLGTPATNVEPKEVQRDKYHYYDDEYNYEYDYYDNGNYESYNYDIKNEEEGNGNGYHEEVVDEKTSTIIFRRITGKFLKEIYDTFLYVRDYCVKTRDELRTVSMISTTRKLEISEQAGKTLLHINAIYISLQRILKRDDTELERNLRNVFEEAGIQPDVAIFTEYRKIISKFTMEANMLLEAVNLIIQAV